MHGFPPESQGQNLALTVLHVPHSLRSVSRIPLPQGKPDHARVSFFGRQGAHQSCFLESKSFIDNLLVQIYFIVVMIRWTGLVQMQFEFLLNRSFLDSTPCQVCPTPFRECLTPEVRNLIGYPRFDITKRVLYHVYP